MNKIFTLCCLLISFQSIAQWRDLTNQFQDSLHMPVSLETNAQTNAIVVNSYPDGGYFVIWEDYRTNNQSDIYAQKYDKDGNRLWTEGGVPVATGPTNQSYTFSFNGDYRNYSYATSDNNGGFFVTWNNWYRVGSYERPGVSVQHVKSNGNTTFSTGKVIAEPILSDGYNYTFPQLVTDSAGGFFLSYLKQAGANSSIYLQAYRLQGNNLQLYASEIMNENARERNYISICGFLRYEVDYMVPVVRDYHIWPDNQGGCNVAMNMHAWDGSPNQGTKELLAYNALKRVKKNSTTTTYKRTSDVANVDDVVTNYYKGDLIKVYKLQTFFYSYACSAGSYTNYLIENFGQGFAILSSDAYDQYLVKGTTVVTGENINITYIGISQRKYINNTVTPFITKLFAFAEEVYDSIPYQRTSDNDIYKAIKVVPPANLKTHQAFSDTVLSTSDYYHDFALRSAGRKIYLTGRMYKTSGTPHLYLQELEVEEASPTSFKTVYKTDSKGGELIGKELHTGFTGTSIHYQFPQIASDELGNALFYVTEQGRYIRASPILEGAKLAWGPMGKPIGTGVFQNRYYTPEKPHVSMRAGKGVLAWNDDRHPPITYHNIYLQLLTNLDVFHSPGKKVAGGLPYGASYITPAISYGKTSQYTTFNTYNSTTGMVSTALELKDDYNLGTVQASVYQHTGAIRMHNGNPYLNRNYTIVTENSPGAGAAIMVRLYFTTADFDALASADATITGPGQLAIIKQPNNLITAPALYSPIAGEEVIAPSAWAAVEGGFYLEVMVSGFSNFFIVKSTSALTVRWMGVQATWRDANHAQITWQVADQVNVNHYHVQHSKDGMNFTTVRTVKASTITNYSSILNANSGEDNYYRIVEEDYDGIKSNSSVVKLEKRSTAETLKIYPNPVRDQLYINNTKEYKSYQLIDASGKTVSTGNLQQGLNKVSMTTLKPGLYIINLSGSSSSKALTIIKD